FALRARKITIPGALATQFHGISGLERSPKADSEMPAFGNAIDTRVRIKTTPYSDLRHRPCQFH
ncbi:MAG: hypothetical protein ACK5HO_10200, partial [Pseudomonadota bacterium]